MNTHTRTPAASHQALMTDLHGTLKRFDDNGMPRIEQLAIIAQVLGYVVGKLPDGEHEASDVKRAVALNMEEGNRAARAREGIIQ